MRKDEPNDTVLARWFENHYLCPDCGTDWVDEWSCTCDDRCPTCDHSITVTKSIDLSRPLTQKDYVGAARILTNSPDATEVEATDEDAREYAEALMEGGEYRFRSELRMRTT